MYREDQLIAAARRENNSKRTYLAVNRKQGKHVPVSPTEAFLLYRALADEIRDKYEGQRLLIIGFAETATAIGASLAVEMDSFYMQTTRENAGDVKYLYFSESHSHATEQKLVRDDLDRVIERIDRIIFAEDELTTGSTILSAIDVIERAYADTNKELSFSAVSILNGMDESALGRYEQRNIGLHFMIKSDHGRYLRAAERYRGDGSYYEAMLAEPRCFVKEWSVSGLVNARRLVRRAIIGSSAMLWQNVFWRRSESAWDSGFSYWVQRNLCILRFIWERFWKKKETM